MEKQETIEQLVDSGVVAVMRGADADAVVDIARALQAGGVTAIELTADTQGVMGLVEEVVAELEDDDAVERGDFETITENAEAMVDAVESAR